MQLAHPKVAQPKLGAYSAPSLLLVLSTHPARMPDGPAKKPGERSTHWLISNKKSFAISGMRTMSCNNIYIYIYKVCECVCVCVCVCAIALSVTKFYLGLRLLTFKSISTFESHESIPP